MSQDLPENFASLVAGSRIRLLKQLGYSCLVLSLYGERLLEECILASTPLPAHQSLSDAESWSTLLKSHEYVRLQIEPADQETEPVMIRAVLDTVETVGEMIHFRLNINLKKSPGPESEKTSQPQLQNIFRKADISSFRIHT